MNPCMTTRYCGRIVKYTASAGSVQAADEFRDEADQLFVKRSADKKPTPAETLARLLDTHNWLRVRKDA